MRYTICISGEHNAMSFYILQQTSHQVDITDC